MTPPAFPPPSPRDAGGSSHPGPQHDATGDLDVTSAARQTLYDQATGWFEQVYQDADGDPDAVPWTRTVPHDQLIAWMDQPGLDLTDVDAVVVGCGLGDDALALARRGARVVAFDISPTAIAWARRRHATSKEADRISWRVADLLALDDDLVGAFGLVVEIATLQSLPATVRDEAMLATASLVGSGGWLVASMLLATSDEAAKTIQGPPWGLAPAELTGFKAAGLQREALAHPPLDERGPATPPAIWVRTSWTRPVDRAAVGDGAVTAPGST